MLLDRNTIGGLSFSMLASTTSLFSLGSNFSSMSFSQEKNAIHIKNNNEIRPLKNVIKVPAYIGSDFDNALGKIYKIFNY